MKEFMGAGTDAGAGTGEAPAAEAKDAAAAPPKGTESEDDLFKEMMQAGSDGGGGKK